MATLERTLSYRRAVWLDVLSAGENLEEFCKRALRKRNQLGKRKLVRSGGQRLVCNKHYSPQVGGLYLHLVADTPGDHASVLSTLDDDKDSSDVGTAKPPRNREYLDGDIFLLIARDNVCMCATALREAAATQYLMFLFDQAELPERTRQFDLQKIADVDKIKLIRKQGVKEIELGASLYEASLKNIDRTLASSSLARLAKHIKAFLDDQKLTVEKDNLSVSLRISGDLRMTGGRAAGDKKLKAIGEDVVLHPDGEYVIVTNSGQRITNDEIVVKKKANIKQQGKSLALRDAWDELLQFYNEIKRNGTVAQ